MIHRTMHDHRPAVMAPALAALISLMSALLAGSLAARGDDETASRTDERNRKVAAASAKPPAIRLGVGLTGTLKGVVLPGPKLAAKRVQRADPCVVRIDAVYPHGTDWRYDLSFFGFEPGRYNLMDYLVRSDGSSTAKLTPIWIDVQSILPADQVTPHAIAVAETPRPGRYRQWLLLAGIAWVAGLIALLLGGRVRRALSGEASSGRPTLADRLRPLVAKAQRSELDLSEQAELERLLISYWQRKLELDDASPAEMMAVLRSHDEAGALLRQLEIWLHRPDRREPADLESLLAPYRNVELPELVHDA